jgi:CRISPR-associated protein Csd1
MLLKLLYDFAHSRDLLKDLAFAPKPIRWIIPLDGEGNLIGPGPQESAGEKNRGLNYSAPQTTRPKVAGGIAEFLADGLTAVFGLDNDPEKDKDNEKKRKDRDANNRAKREDFWRQIREAFDETQHPVLTALLRFHEQAQDSPPFLRWGVSQELKSSEKPNWWLITATGNEVKLGPDNFTFKVDGCLLLDDDIQLRPYWRKVYRKEIENTTTTAKRGICLITGDSDAPIAPTHSPKVKGVPNTQSFGAAIVSFDKPAFASYGFDQSHNAPGSTEAVSAYCNALNYLLSQDNHNLRIGQTSVCFWARETKSASSFVARKLNNPDPAGVAEFLKAPWAGLDRELARHDRFYSVTLSGNAGRIVVRHWMQTTLEMAVENLWKWFDDLDITPYGDPTVYEKRKRKTKSDGGENDNGMPPLALFRLACSTVREAKDLQTETLTQLYRASLEGTAPTVMLLKPILNRLNADLVRYGPKTLANLSRFALMRLILNRNQKEKELMIKPQVFETTDRAYNCGRLLAILDSLQRSAHGRGFDGATIAERYFGSASTTPNTAFSILWKLHQHHLKKLRQQGDKGKRGAAKIKESITHITSLFQPESPGAAPQFPRYFSLVEQGRFTLGFYQQMAFRKAAIDEYVRKKKAGELNPEDMDVELDLSENEQ